MSTTKPINIILFHAKWCGYCVNFEPIWEDMKNDRKADQIIYFKSYEETEMNDLDKAIKTINGKEIHGFPTIKIIIYGKEYNYEGKRKKENIFKFIKDKLSKMVDDPHAIELSERFSVNKTKQLKPVIKSNRFNINPIMSIEEMMMLY